MNFAQFVCGPIGVRGLKPSFTELAQARKFAEIIRILRHDESSAKEWLEKEESALLNPPPLLTLCRHQPTVGVLRIVLAQTSLWTFDSEGCSALHIAIRHHCSLNVIELLVKHDPDIVSVHDNDGRLALHYLMATKWRRSQQRMVAIAHILIKAMPRSVTRKDAWGVTPYDLALANKHMNVPLLDAMRVLVGTTRSMKKDRTSETDMTSSPSRSQVSLGVPRSVMPGAHEEDDLSSVGSGGISKHVGCAYKKERSCFRRLLI